MQDLAARAYFALCLVLGRLLRSARYSATPTPSETGDKVRKHRRFYAPVFIWMGDVVVRILDTGVRVLPQREWEQRERLIYQALHGVSIGIDVDGALLLPRLAGHTLAKLLDDPALDYSVRRQAIQSAVVALAEFHARGFTHGDAMAENVLIRFSEAGSSDAAHCIANWFDFETVHDPSRSVVWQRADDVRALLVTCLIRTLQEQRAEMLRLILDGYGDADVTRVLASTFTAVWRRSLAFHLAQAPLTFQEFGQIGSVLESTSRATEAEQDAIRRPQ